MNAPTTQAQQQGKIKLYVCGGTGINIGSALEGYRNHKEKGMADIDAVFLDTSRANLKPHLPEDKIYILKRDDGSEGTIKETDGSGKDRAKNADLAMKHIKDIMQKHRPGYVNVTLSSASGGTGAVIAAVVANELVAQGEMTISITVGVTDSGTDIDNTILTLNSFEGIVKSNGKTLPVAYFENTKATPPSVVDSEITELLVAIAVLFSRQNEGLDTQDMIHFLNVDKKTPHKPQVAGLVSYAGVLNQDDHKDTITVASAIVDKDNRGVDFVLPYTTYGILPASISDEIGAQAPIHLVTKAYPFNGIIRRLRDIQAELDKAAKASTAQSELMGNDVVLEGGFLALG